MSGSYRDQVAMSERYRDAMCPDCGSILTGSREPGDEDRCVETGEEVVLVEPSIDARLERLDELTLEEYPYRVDLQIGILTDPGNDPREWAENVQMYVEDQLSGLPCVVLADVTGRHQGTGHDCEFDPGEIGGPSYASPDAMAAGLAAHLRSLADRLESGELCNGEVWERLYADGPEPVEYTAGPVEEAGNESTDREHVGGDAR